MGWFVVPEDDKGSARSEPAAPSTDKGDELIAKYVSGVAPTPVPGPAKPDRPPSLASGSLRAPLAPVPGPAAAHPGAPDDAVRPIPSAVFASGATVDFNPVYES